MENIEQGKSIEKFTKLGIKAELADAIKEAKFTEPSEIQEKSIPKILEGKDVIGEAATGSGKTLAYSSGIVQNLERTGKTQALVLVPTRELAEQVCQTLVKFTKYKRLSVTPVYGGVGMGGQIDKLTFADVVVGTPGRILDHLGRGTLRLDKIKILVLDEADRMLDMGFIRDIEKIVRMCNSERQTLLFSATVSGEIANIAKRYMKNPETVSVKNTIDPSKLTQVYYDLPDNQKFSLLVHLLKNEKAGLVMVFCATKHMADTVSKNLRKNDIDAAAIHGGLSQYKRNSVLKDFHSGRCGVMVCTDIAARGLDIPGVSHVYNFDLPREKENYIHRIGRTARAGKDGKAISILGSKDYENFSRIQGRLADVKLEETPEFEIVSLVKERSSDDGGFRRGGRDSRGRGFGGRGRSDDRPRRRETADGHEDRRGFGRANSRPFQRRSRY